LNSTLTRLALDGLYYTGSYRLLEPAWSGVGVIFTLHHVCDAEDRPEFSPNRILEISPEFLDQTIRQVRESGYDIVTLDEVRRRLIEGDFTRKFVCFTLDDGYADNYSVAFPIFAKYKAPFTVYVTTGLLDGTVIMWWRHLEDIILKENEINLRLHDRDFHFLTDSTQRKYRAFEEIYWYMRGLTHQQQGDAIQRLEEQYKIDSPALCRQWAMSWSMVKELAESELATIGAHTLNHYAMSKLPADQARDEAELSRQQIAEKTGHTPVHFTYPFGDKASAARREFDIAEQLGFATATTTRKGIVFPEHASHLQALPRVSLNGDYQNRRYVQLFLSGAPFALSQRFRRLDTE
jgi:peptidoglycan/xylan/chitin deacetylase (PgdA/CDA1 family)